MAIVKAAKRMLNKLRLPSGKNISTDPIDDGYYANMLTSIFGAFEGYASQITIPSYREIERKNPEINSNFRNRRIGMLSFGWKIKPASSEEKDKEVAEFVKYVLENIEVQTLEQSLRWLMYALRDEFELLQILPKYFESGPWAGKAGLRWLVPISRMAAEPVLEHKQLKAFKIGQIEYDAADFLVYSHEPTDIKPMGTSLFDALVWYDWFFKNGMAFWSAYLDRFGMPLVVVKEKSKLNKEDAARIETVVENINAGYSVKIPKNVEIEIIKAASGGKTGYENYVKYCGELVVKILVGQTQATGTAEFSTRAQSTVHKQILSEYNQVDGQEISGAVQRQLIPLLVEWNYPGREYPKFSIITDKPEEQDKKSVRVHTALLDGLPLKKEEAYEGHGFTVPEDGDEVISFQQRAEEPPPPPGEEDEGDDDDESFAETNNNRRSNRSKEDTDGFVEKYSENYKKVTAQLPELVMAIIDRASRGMQPEPIDDKKKK